MIAFFKRPSAKWLTLGFAVALVAVVVVLIHARVVPRRTVPVTALGGVQSVMMLNERAGWVLTGSAVLRTTDGGARWADVTPAAAAGATSGYAAGSLTAVDADTAYATFSQKDSTSIFVFRTANAGHTWARAEIPQEPEIWSATGPETAPPVTSFQFTDARHGWLLAGYGVALGSEAVRIYATADAGATWQLVDDVTGTPLAPASLPFGGHKTGLAFADSNKGWVSGFDYGGSIWLYATQDGGRAWSRQSVAAPPGYPTEGGSVETRPPIFFGGSQKDGLLPVVFHTEGQPTIFFVTHDGGATWQPTAAVVSATNSAFVWSFSDAEHGFATDGDKLYVTVDGARSWQAIATGISLSGLTQLDFVSGKVGWAIVNGSLIKTSDGGLTWTEPA